jgi:hypothetical protein
MGVDSSPLRRTSGWGGDGVDIGTDEGAVVWDEREDTLSDFSGVDMPEMREPSDKSKE